MARTVSCILALQQCYQKDSMSISVIPEKALGQILMNRSWPSLGYMTIFSHHSGHQDAFLWLAQPGLSGHFCSSLEGSSSNWITRTESRRRGIQRETEVLLPNECRGQWVLGRRIKWKEGQKEGRGRSKRKTEKPCLLPLLSGTGAATHTTSLWPSAGLFPYWASTSSCAEMRDVDKCSRSFPVLGILWWHVIYTQMLLKSHITGVREPEGTPYLNLKRRWFWKKKNTRTTCLTELIV